MYIYIKKIIILVRDVLIAVFVPESLQYQGKKKRDTSLYANKPREALVQNKQNTSISKNRPAKSNPFNCIKLGCQKKIYYTNLIF